MTERLSSISTAPVRMDDAEGAIAPQAEIDQVVWSIRASCPTCRSRR
jgi:hypothetical protein